MGREYQIFGEFIINVRGGDHLPGDPFNTDGIAELGLTSEAVTVIPRYRHNDIYTDDLGPEVPAEIMSQMADAQIRMTLVHYDETVLQCCMQEALAGGNGTYALALGNEGTFPAGGKLMGNNLPLFASGNYFMSVSLFPATNVKGWRFFSCYLDSQPLIIPVGTERSLAQLSWRAVPYTPLNEEGEALAEGTTLWDRIPDQYTDT